MSSILTNNGAMVALQTLKGINESLNTTQNEISTGKTINSAKDNAAVWAISKVMESDVAGFKAVSDSLSLANGVVTNARNAAETVGKLIDQIKGKIVSAQDGNQDRATLQKDVNDLKKQITKTVSASQFSGINLVNGSTITDVDDGAGGTVNGFKVLASLDRASGSLTASSIEIDLTGTDLTLAGGLAALDAIDLSDATLTASDLQTALDTAEAALKTAVDVASKFGTANKRIEIQSDFISKLSDSMVSAIGAVVDTNMEEASARLKALQTQQQLGVQSLSIANSAPQALLALFR